MDYPGHSLQIGSSGEEVKAIQAKLQVEQTGLFGPTTLAAVKGFQSVHGLQPDGVVGPKTWATLFAGKLNTALRFTLQWEGGYVNRADDPGGATNKGITWRTYSTWLTKHGHPQRPVALISDEEVETIYRENYWDYCGCEALDLPVAVAVFDSAVNCGQASAKEFLANARIRAQVDTGPHVMAEMVIQQREAYYKKIIARNAKLHAFKDGWANRVRALRAFVQRLQ